MKRKVKIYIVACVTLVLVQGLVYGIIGKVSLPAFVIINLVLPSLIIILANAMINFVVDGTIKKCLFHAIILAFISLLINLGTNSIMGNKVEESLSANQEMITNEDTNQEILDELDRQARQKMIAEGLITEDENIYTEEYINGGEKNTQDANTLTGTWDVQIEKENTLSTITGAILDVVFAFLGGMLGLKLKKKVFE